MFFREAFRLAKLIFGLPGVIFLSFQKRSVIARGTAAADVLIRWR